MCISETVNSRVPFLLKPPLFNKPPKYARRRAAANGHALVAPGHWGPRAWVLGYVFFGEPKKGDITMGHGFISKLLMVIAMLLVM